MNSVSIHDYLEARRVVDRDPDIDPDIFWPRVGISVEAITAIGRDGIKAYPQLHLGAMMSILEVGATLAEAGIRGQA